MTTDKLKHTDLSNLSLDDKYDAILLNFAGREVEALVKDSGLQHCYTGKLRCQGLFDQPEETIILIGNELIFLSCIVKIKLT